MTTRRRELPRPATASMLRRYRDIAGVLVRHGLADVVDTLLLRPYLAWGMRLGRRRPADGGLSRAARMRLVLEELGPTFVKFGQALSVRADLLPPELIAELVKLQDQATPLAAGVAETAIEEELGRPWASLFASFDHEPLAAASIAQVHAATLDDGRRVVVKVRRPGIADLITNDIEILLQLSRVVERRVPAAAVLGPVALVEEFARSIRAELDFVREARNVDRCRRDFEGDPIVRFPLVHWDLTTRGVLTLERLDGIKVSRLDEAGAGEFVKRLVARRGADVMLRQILVHGFFHADPHPGNILVLDDQVIGLLDFGIVGRLDDRMRAQLARVIRAIWQRDIEDLTTLALDITGAHADVDVDRSVLERDLAVLVDTYGDVPLGDLSARAVLMDVVRVMAAHRLRMPSPLMVLIKALVTIEGVGLELDPSFRIVEHAAPMAEQIWKRELAPGRLGERALDALQESLVALHRLPLHLEAIGRKARDGRLEVRFVHRNLDHLVQEMDRSTNRVAFAVIIAALIVGSSLIILIERGPLLFGYPVLGLAGYLVAGVFGMGLAVAILRSGRL